LKSKWKGIVAIDNLRGSFTAGAFLHFIGNTPLYSIFLRLSEFQNTPHYEKGKFINEIAEFVRQLWEGEWEKLTPFKLVSALSIAGQDN